MRVIDSSSLVKYFSREEGWRKVREYLLEGVVSTDLVVKEVGNALWKKIIRGEMTLKIAQEILSDLAKGTAIKLLDQKEHLAKALEIAVRNKITIYDALFIALAKNLNTELITSDTRQAKAAKKEGVETIIV